MLESLYIEEDKRSSNLVVKKQPLPTNLQELQVKLKNEAKLKRNIESILASVGGQADDLNP